MNVSAHIIARDEESCIGKALDSLKGKVQEIVVVVDTRTIDNTKQFVTDNYPDVKVYDFEWGNESFGDARTYAVSKCTKDWLFYIDADEVFEGEFPEELKDGIYNFDIKNMTDSGAFVNSVCSRLAKNVPGVKFGKPIHEIFESTEVNLPIYKFNHGHIVHSGYLSSERERKDKNKRNIDALNRQYKEKASSPICFYLSQENFLRKNVTIAKELAEEGLNLIDPNNALDLTFQPLLYHALITSLVELGDEKGVKKFEEEMLDKSNNPECYQMMMHWYMNKGDEGNFVKYAHQVLKYNNAGMLPPKFVEANIRFVPYVTMAQFYVNTKKDHLMGLYFLELAYGSGLNDLKLLIDIYNLLPKSERNVKKWEFYNKKIYEATGDKNILKDLVGCYLAYNDAEHAENAISLANDLFDEAELKKLKDSLVLMGREELVSKVK